MIDLIYRLTVTFIPTSGLVYVFWQGIDPNHTPTPWEIVAAGSLAVLILDKVFGFIGPLIRKKIGGNGNGSSRGNSIGEQSIEFTEQLVHDEMESVMDDKMESMKSHMDREIELLQQISIKLDRLNENMAVLKDRRSGSRQGG